MTLIGSGFPSEVTNDWSISICGNAVTEITPVSNTELRFVVPAEVSTCASAGSQISVGGQTASITFSYDPSLTPTISSLSRTSASPILKTTLTITGSGFGSQANTKVFLSQNGVHVYELSLISVSSTEIVCILGGGKSGNYDVTVVDSTVGGSVSTAASSFEYRIFVDSLSISSGASSGGYSLTISGRNLAPSRGSNTVFIGDDVSNAICEITAISETQIICTVPRILADMTIGNAYDVVVTGRLLEESVCTGTCTFTYETLTTNQIALPASSVANNGATVTITGQAGSDLTGATVKIKDIECVVTSSSASSLVFTFPNIPAGAY